MRDILLAAGLVLAGLAAYLPALGGGFVWNDLEYVTAPHLRDLAGLGRIWCEPGATEQYYPLLHSAFWVQHRLWGDATVGYHLANLAEHLLAAGVLVALLRRLGVPGAWLASFLFALHPLAVESVAWITEQKNTLSLLFYLLAALAYLRFESTRAPRDYALALLAFLAALLSKSMTVTLPAALLVVHWWRRGRLEWRRDVLPLLPWFAAAALMSAMTIWVERTYVGAAGEDFALAPAERLLVAGRALWFYAAKVVWPAGLVFIYPQWVPEAGAAGQWVYPLAAVAVFAWLAARARIDRTPLAVALLFAGTLFPVLGFFSLYGFLYSSVADHWVYHALPAPLALAAAGVVGLGARLPSGFSVGLPVALLAMLGGLTWRHSHAFRDLETLYRTTITRNPDSWMAHHNLGSHLRETDRREEARWHYERARELRPQSAKPHHNLAVLAREEGRLEEALGFARRAVEIDPRSALAQDFLGQCLREAGRPTEALSHHREAVRLEPERADAHNNLGMALREAGHLEGAAGAFGEAIRLAPGMAAAHLNLALTRSLQGRHDDAVRHYREARRLNPSLPALPGY